MNEAATTTTKIIDETRHIHPETEQVHDRSLCEALDCTFDELAESYVEAHLVYVEAGASHSGTKSHAIWGGTALYCTTNMPRPAIVLPNVSILDIDCKRCRKMLGIDEIVAENEAIVEEARLEALEAEYLAAELVEAESTNRYGVALTVKDVRQATRKDFDFFALVHIGGGSITVKLTKSDVRRQLKGMDSDQLVDGVWDTRSITLG